ncbi:MAG: acetylglutamate kinase [Alphaproteobacteria bacterium]|nr:acetylglutamate kinase [Alphaproteobacteria bacterium]
MKTKPLTTPETLLHTAATLSEALPYMRRFAGETFVIKYGGHAMGDQALAEKFARDVVLLKQVGIHPVVVHGGGPQIGQMLERLKIKSEFVDGLRVTDKATVEVVEMVLAGSINKQVVSLISNAGGKALGVSGKDGQLLTAKRLQRQKAHGDSHIEQVLDLGFVGEPHRVNPNLIQELVASDYIPVIAPIGFGEDGETYNINADTAAGAIAGALHASKLLMLTDVAGVLNAQGELVSELSVSEAHGLIADGTISGGMIPKIETCIDALNRNAGKAHILNGKVPHVLLVEIFTDYGAGTMVLHD